MVNSYLETWQNNCGANRRMSLLTLSEPNAASLRPRSNSVGVLSANLIPDHRTPTPFFHSGKCFSYSSSKKKFDSPVMVITGKYPMLYNLKSRKFAKYYTKNCQNIIAVILLLLVIAFGALFLTGNVFKSNNICFGEKFCYPSASSKKYSKNFKVFSDVLKQRGKDHLPKRFQEININQETVDVRSRIIHLNSIPRVVGKIAEKDTTAQNVEERKISPQLQKFKRSNNNKLSDDINNVGVEKRTFLGNEKRQHYEEYQETMRILNKESRHSKLNSPFMRKRDLFESVNDRNGINIHREKMHRYGYHSMPPGVNPIIYERGYEF